MRAWPWLLVFSLAACASDDGGSGGASGSAGPSVDPTGAPGQGPPCMPGQSFTCMCSPTEMGTRICQSDGLSECRCGLNDPGNQQFGCDPSEPLRLPCQCDDGRNGVKRCGADGILQDCDCDDLGSGGAGSDPDADAG